MRKLRCWVASVMLTGGLLGASAAHTQGVDPVQQFLQEGVTQYEAGVQAFNRGDYRGALERWRPLAEIGSVDAQNNLGFLYVNGLGVPQDYEAALKWYRRSAQQGNAAGQHNLGVMYARGLGVPENQDEALTWYRRSADQGYPEAARSLGLVYHHGRGVAPDPLEAYMWFQIAAQLGHPTASQAASLLARDLAPEDIAEGRAKAARWLGERSR